MDASTASVGLVVGAGGPTGGPFIDAALDVLATETGWNPSWAKRIVGTSAGAFVAARVEPLEAGADSDALAERIEPEQIKSVEALIGASNISDMRATTGTKIIRGVRIGGGRVVALLAPPEREPALYTVPPGPYHPGASAVAIEHTWGLRREFRLVEHPDEVEDIIRASSAIPFKDAPVRVGRTLYADGAVHSANNVDLVDPDECPLLVVISPMIPSSGGTKTSNFHRAQLFEELRPWQSKGRTAVVIMPTGQEHEKRRDREFFTKAGTLAAQRLFA